MGAYRGVQDYDKKYNKDYNFYLKNPNSKRPEYYYTDVVASSFMGFICYANPLILPFFLASEIRYLESEIRGIKKD